MTTCAKSGAMGSRSGNRTEQSSGCGVAHSVPVPMTTPATTGMLRSRTGMRARIAGYSGRRRAAVAARAKPDGALPRGRDSKPAPLFFSTIVSYPIDAAAVSVYVMNMEKRNMEHRRETNKECKCGRQVVEYITVQTESGREYMAWVCVRCGRERRA